MRYGIWTPLPHTVRSDAAMADAVADLRTPGAGGAVDKSFGIAVDVVRRAEALGFETTLIAERHLGPDLEAWILTSALIAHTSRIELMCAVHPGIVSPQLAAKMGASLDRISGGRFAVNVVNGWYEKEFDVFGNGGWLDHSDARYRRMGEFVDVMKGLWTGEKFTLEGEFYRCESGELPIRPVQTPNPPIYAASRSDAGKEVVARTCDVWFVNYDPGYANAEANLAGIARDIEDLDRRSESYGRSLSYGISAHVICTGSAGEAEERVRELEEYGRRDPVSAVAAKGLGAGLVGTPRQVADRLRYLESIGIDCPMVHFYPMMEGLENFAATVMPLVEGR